MEDYPFKYTENDTPLIRAKVTSDLDSIVDEIKRNYPEATIVLSGSYACGEGRVEEGECISTANDYDVYVILSSIKGFFSALGSKKPAMLKTRLSQDHRFTVDLNLIWKPLLGLGLTCVAGKVIGGDRTIESLINRVPIRRRKLQVSYLKKGYLMLILALTLRDSKESFLQKALACGFYSFLGLKETKQEIQTCWKRYFSRRYLLGLTEKYGSELNPDICQLIRSVLIGKLKSEEGSFEFNQQSIDLTKGFLDGLTLQISHTFRWADYFQYLFQHLRNHTFPALFVDPNRLILKATVGLTDAMLHKRVDGRGDIDHAVRALYLLAKERPPKEGPEILEWCLEKVMLWGDLYLHKIGIERRPVTLIRQ